MKRIDDAWQFTPDWSEDFLKGENEYEEIRIPHTVKEYPLHYIDVNSYQMICGYRRHLKIHDLNKRYFLQFDGAAHIATVYVNGKICSSMNADILLSVLKLQTQSMKEIISSASN